jgi:hypothetical protein
MYSWKKNRSRHREWAEKRRIAVMPGAARRRHIVWHRSTDICGRKPMVQETVQQVVSTNVQGETTETHQTNKQFQTCSRYRRRSTPNGRSGIQRNSNRHITASNNLYIGMQKKNT